MRAKELIAISKDNNKIQIKPRNKINKINESDKFISPSNRCDLQVVTIYKYEESIQC